MRAIHVHQQGGPEVLTLEPDVAIPEPQAEEAVVRLEHIGVNFIDVYQRSGLYRLSLPFIPGNEGAGTVAAVGGDVRHVAPGDRVGWAMATGSYAEYARVPASRLVPLPGDVDTRTAAAIMLQGLTAQYLTRSTFAIKPGDTMAVLAAAGGLGLLLVQVGKHLGARVIGLTSTDEKAGRVKAAGADDVVLSSRADYAEALRAQTDGRGVDVIYDSVGKDTVDRSLDSLRPRGMLVLVGQSSGAVAPIDPSRLASRSLYVTRPSLAHYIATYEELSERAAETFDWLRRGVMTVTIDRTFPLAQAADAHRRLQSRKSVGKILLEP